MRGWLLPVLLAVMPLSTEASPQSQKPGDALTVLGTTATNNRVLQGVELLYESRDQALTPEAVTSAAFADRWQPRPTDRVRGSWESQAVWERFTIRNASSQADWLLSVESPLLADVSAFQLVRPKEGLPKALNNSADPLTVIPLFSDSDTDPGYTFRLPLGPGEETTVLMRVRSDVVVFPPPISIWETRAYQRQRDGYAMAAGLMFGIFGIMALYSAWVYILTLKAANAWFSIYLIAVALYELTTTGYGSLYLWGHTGWLNEPGYAVFACLPFLAATFFYYAVLDRENELALWESRVLIVVGLLWVIATVVAALIIPTPQLCPIIAFGVVTLLVLLGSALRIAIQGNPTGFFLSVAWAASIAGGACTLLELEGSIPSGDAALNAQPAGFLMATMLISAALAQRIDQERKRDSQLLAEQKGETELLGRSLEHERSARIFAQAQAVDVQRQCDSLLESRVKERTAILEQAMQQVAVANVELADLSNTDALTQVYNRRHFDLKLRQERAHFTRSYQPMSLLMIDIDKFKSINDRFGHPVGDEALRRVASALVSATRLADTVARYGGEEFAVILPDATIAQAAIVAERMRKSIDRLELRVGGDLVKLNVSIGIAAAPAASTETPDALVERADQALLRAKQGGRNRVVEADPEVYP